MKKTIKTTILLLFAFALVLALVSCNTVKKTGLWEDAEYRKDMEFGKGSKTVVVEVKAEDEMVSFTIHTDKTTVGAALLEHGLIEGEDSIYGMYVKVVNGMRADFDEDQSYWGFYIDGELSFTGVDTTEITEGVTYQLVYTR